MVIGLLEIDLHFPEAQSLKDKRQPLRSILARVRQNHNVSIAEVAHQNVWQRAALAMHLVVDRAPVGLESHAPIVRAGIGRSRDPGSDQSPSTSSPQRADSAAPRPATPRPRAHGAVQ